MWFVDSNATGGVCGERQALSVLGEGTDLLLLVTT